MGFTLGIINAPAGATAWTAFFYSHKEGDFIKPPEPLALDEVWNCAVDPEGTTNLHIGVKDEVRNIILIDVRGLGPVNDGKDYIYDCSTGILSERDGEIGVSLKAGGNYVVYTGKVQTAEAAFASIMSYLDPTKVVYYWNNYTGLYELVITTTTMVPYGVYSVNVTQNCLWTYGAEATALSSVYLWGGRYNIVPYCGEAVPPVEALASILPYLSTVFWVCHYNNTTKVWDIVATFESGVWKYYQTLMVPNGVYAVAVTQNCVWTFVAPPIEITAPDSAEEGATVPVSVKVTNTRDIGYKFKTEVSAVPDAYPSYLIFSAEDTILAGNSKTYDTPFTMPDCNTTIFVSVKRWEFNRWNYEGVASKVVSLEAIQYKGTISKMELEYNETRGDIPVSDVPQGKEGKVHIWGRNDMSTNQKLGIYWIVKDPDGVVVEEYSDWESWPNTDPDKTHEFISPGRFDLAKVGTYAISVGLLMNPDDPLYVDIYFDDLCTVVAELVPTFSELKISSFSKR